MVLSVVVASGMVVCGGQKERWKLLLVCSGGVVMHYQSWLLLLEVMMDLLAWGRSHWCLLGIAVGGETESVVDAARERESCQCRRGEREMLTVVEVKMERLAEGDRLDDYLSVLGKKTLSVVQLSLV